MMLCILKVIRRFGAIKRHVFGRSLPHWLNDVVKIVGHLDLIAFIVTILGIALAPRHFFQRVPIVLSSKNTIYATPVKFLVTGCPLIVGLGYLLARFRRFALPWTDTQAYLAVVLIIFATPIWVLLVCFLNRVVLGMLSIFRSLMTPLGHSISLGRLGNEAKIPISPSTYRRINFWAYLWCMMYYSIYAYFALQAVEFVVPLSVPVVARLVHRLPDVFPNSMYQSLIGMTAVLAILFSFTHRFIVRPYVDLLKASVYFPTKRMHLSDCSELILWIDDAKNNRLLDPHPDDLRIRVPEERRAIPIRAPNIMSALRGLERLLLSQDGLLRELPPDRQAQLIHERADVYRALDVADIRKRVQETPMPEQPAKLFEEILTRIEFARDRAVGAHIKFEAA